MYRKQSAEWAKHIDFIILDILCMQVAFLIAYFLRHGDGITSDTVYHQLALECTFIDFFVIIVFNSFQNVLKRGFYKELLATVKHVVVFLVTVTLFLFAMKEGGQYSRIFTFAMLPFYAVISYLVRMIWKTIIKRRWLSRGARSLLILSDAEHLESTVYDIVGASYNGYSNVSAAALDRKIPEKELHGVPVVANGENIEEYLKREWIDSVLLAFPVGPQFPYELYHNLKEMGVTVHMVIAKNSDMSENRQQVERIGHFTVMTSSLNYAPRWELAMKRFMDICGGLVGCLITLLFVLIFGPMIKIASPGPIFFSQYRVGRNGKIFKIYKFRSMYMDAEERKKELMAQSNYSDGMMFKMDFDPRIIGNKILPDGSHKTGLGQFIRKTSIDEFPQFLNILKGDMSLVGTRPPTLDEWEKYELRHKARMAFRPGLTGMWQVSGRSQITDFEEVVKLDTKYIDEWNIGLDIKILFKTVLSVLKNEGAM